VRRGHEHDFHTTTPPPSGCDPLKIINELAKLVVQLVPRDDLLAVNAAWLVFCLLSALDVPLDAVDAEHVSTM